MAAGDREVKIKITADISDASKNAQKLSQQLSSLGGGSGGGAGSGATSLRDVFGKQMVGGLEAANKSLGGLKSKVGEMTKFTDAQSNSVAKLSGEYKKLANLNTWANSADDQ